MASFAHWFPGLPASALASNHISTLLRAQGHEVELEIIKTTGDKILDVALPKSAPRACSQKKSKKL